jgi:predicted Zn-dependent peptidase
MLDRTVAPAFRQIEHIPIKEPEVLQVNRDIPFYSIQAGTQSVVKLELIFEAGKWFETKPGVSFFTGKMLREGAGTLNSYDISNLFESYGAHLEITPTLDFTSINIYSLEKYINKLLPVVKLMIEEPVFPESELETLKNIQIQSLRVNNEKNNFVASKKFRETLFNDKHPYGHILEEPEILSVSSSDLKTHFQHTFFQKPFTIVGSGLFGGNSEQAIIDTFSSISIQTSVKAEEHSFDPQHSNVFIDKEESSQSSIRMGYLTIPMKHPDYAGLLVTNEILGGYFGSRLMKNIREEKGLTYGIYSSLSSLKHSTIFSISADVKKELREQAISEIQSEILRLRTEQVSFHELDTVRNYMLGQIQASVNTPFALAAKFKNVHFNELDYGYYTNLIETIKSITPERIMELANTYLREKDMVQVYVG